MARSSRKPRGAGSRSASPTGSPAWLDLKTQFGNVANNLDAAAQPEAGEDTVEVRARTAFGDITINRSIARGAKTT